MTQHHTPPHHSTSQHITAHHSSKLVMSSGSATAHVVALEAHPRDLVGHHLRVVSCFLEAHRKQEPRATALQAVPFLHHIRFGPCTPLCSCHRGCPRGSELRSLWSCTFCRRHAPSQFPRIPCIAGSRSSSGWRVLGRTCSPLSCRFPFLPPSVARPPRHPSPLFVAPAGCCNVLGRWHCVTVLCLSGSPLPVTFDYKRLGKFQQGLRTGHRPQFAPALWLLIWAWLRPPFVESNHPDAGPKLYRFVTRTHATRDLHSLQEFWVHPAASSPLPRRGLSAGWVPPLPPC